MPATSEKQRKAMGVALAAKRGKIPASKLKGPSKQMVSSMSEGQLRDFAKKSGTVKFSGLMTAVQGTTPTPVAAPTPTTPQKMPSVPQAASKPTTAAATGNISSPTQAVSAAKPPIAKLASVKQADDSDILSPGNTNDSEYDKKEKREYEGKTPVYADKGGPTANVPEVIIGCPTGKDTKTDKFSGDTNGNSAFIGKEAQVNPLVAYMMPTLVKQALKLNPEGLASGEPVKAHKHIKDHPEQIEMGKNIEHEHVESDSKAKAIAADHLTEDPKYYTHLKAMESAVEEKRPVAQAVKQALMSKWSMPGGPGTSGFGSGIVTPQSTMPTANSAPAASGNTTSTAPTASSTPAAPLRAGEVRLGDGATYSTNNAINKTQGDLRNYQSDIYNKNPNDSRGRPSEAVAYGNMQAARGQINMAVNPKSYQNIQQPEVSTLNTPEVADQPSDSKPVAQQAAAPVQPAKTAPTDTETISPDNPMKAVPTPKQPAALQSVTDNQTFGGMVSDRFNAVSNMFKPTVIQPKSANPVHPANTAPTIIPSTSADSPMKGVTPMKQPTMPKLGAADNPDIKSIVDFISTNPNLDDGTLDQFVQAKGYDPELVAQAVDQHMGQQVAKSSALQQAFAKGVTQVVKDARLNSKGVQVLSTVLENMLPEFSNGIGIFKQAIAGGNIGQNKGGGMGNPQVSEAVQGMQDSSTAAQRFMKNVAMNRLKQHKGAKKGIIPHPQDIFGAHGNQLAIKQVAESRNPTNQSDPVPQNGSIYG